jgi:hypothetical protein
VSLLDSHDVVTPTAAGQLVTLAVTGGATLYSDAGCTMALGATSTMTMAGTYTFYLMKGAGAANVLISATDPTGGADTDTDPNSNYSSASAGVLIQTYYFKVNGRTVPIITNSCIPYTARLVNSAGVPVTSATDATITAYTATGFGTYYSDSACSVATTSLTITAGSTVSSIFYYKPTANNTHNLCTTGTMGATALTCLSNTSVDSNVADMKIEGATGPAKDTCAPYRMTIRETSSGSSYAAPAPSGLTITALNTSGTGAYYDDVNCTSPVTLPISVTTGSSFSPTFYYKATASGMATLSCTSGVMCNSLAITVP